MEGVPSLRNFIFFVSVDECLEAKALALARNNGQRGVMLLPSGASESGSEEISMTFIGFLAIGLEGEGETVRERGDLSIIFFRGDFFKKSPRSDDSPDKSSYFFLLEGEGGTLAL